MFVFHRATLVEELSTTAGFMVSMFWLEKIHAGHQQHSWISAIKTIWAGLKILLDQLQTQDMMSKLFILFDLRMNIKP